MLDNKKLMKIKIPTLKCSSKKRNMICTMINKEMKLSLFRIYHIVPLCEEGKDTLENAITVCLNCHRKVYFGI